ncbi:hypothetical protein D1P53_004955 [Cryptococcus gattii VGV]|nr:hypothetical protein D1P53_004955 [Cryptococcus gattii VGV]
MSSPLQNKALGGWTSVTLEFTMGSPPAFLVKKENGKFWFICDYQGLNKVTMPDSTLVPNVDNILHHAACGKIFTKIDLSNAFFQTLMHEPDIKKTAITTELGLFKWVVMPQGACNSPATQQC